VAAIVSILVAGVLFTGFLAVAVFPAWLLMLLMGVLASVTGWPVAIGFIPCFIIVLIMAILA
jgi:hypothetical protein